ncbi:MAG: GNAT family N-acetyltransferase [Acidobacteriota bacterium]
MPHLRTARHDDIPALQALIDRSGVELSRSFYTPTQAEAITRHVFGVDSQLIEDGTYFAIEEEGEVVACGGWSRRDTLFGGDQAKTGPDPHLDPATEPARIRAFFVAPKMARRGLARQLMDECEQRAREAGFRELALVATLPGEPFYRACGFTVTERFELHLPDGVDVPVTRMHRPLGP